MSISPLKAKTQTAPTEGKTPPPPAHLSKKAKAFWISVFERRTMQRLQPYQVEILLKALEARDRCEQARRILKKEGLIYRDRFNQPKPRPEINVEILNRAQYTKLLERVGLFDPFF